MVFDLCSTAHLRRALPAARRIKHNDGIASRKARRDVQGQCVYQACLPIHGNPIVHHTFHHALAEYATFDLQPTA